jgi:hypothetical protein
MADQEQNTNHITDVAMTKTGAVADQSPLDSLEAPYIPPEVIASYVLATFARRKS